MEKKQLFLCRICLKVGAIHCIFDSIGAGCILNKLSMCLNEKIEDLDGFPRYICDECNINLDTLCNFIKRFKSTNTILKNSLHLRKINQETEQSNNSSENEDSKIDLKIVSVKSEADTDLNSDFSDNNVCKDNFQPITTRKRPIKSKSNKINRGTKKKKNTGKEVSLICSKKINATDKLVGTNTNECQKLARLAKLPKEKTTLAPNLCHICGAVFEKSKDLYSHKQTKHRIKVECAHCQKSFASKYYLMKHIKRVHGGPKDFICSKCSKAFAFKNELTSHMSQVHNKKVVKKKQFSCKICNKTYNCEKSVIIHERSVHTGERPAVCRVCGSSFFHNEYLLQHMRLHTGQTPYKCPVCGRGHAQQGNMKSHLRIHRRSELDSETLKKIRPNHLRLLKP